MKKKYTPYNGLPDLKAYTLGMTSALRRQQLVKKPNPYSKLFQKDSHHCFDLGLKMGYQKGVEIRETSHAYDYMKEERRKRELADLQKHQQQVKSKER